MIKLFMKQKVFSWNTHFTVKDEQERDRFTVEGEFFTFGRKLHILDRSGAEVALVQQKVFSFLPRFYLFVEGVKVAEIIKEFSFLRPRYRIEGLDWQITGDFWAHEYEIISRGLPIVSVSKTWLSWGDSYALEIAHPEDTTLALAVVLAIDCVMDQQAVAASAAT